MTTTSNSESLKILRRFGTIGKLGRLKERAQLCLFDLISSSSRGHSARSRYPFLYDACIYVASLSCWVERKNRSMRLNVYSRVKRLIFLSLPKSYAGWWTMWEVMRPFDETTSLSHFATHTCTHSNYPTLSTGTMCYSPVQYDETNNVKLSENLLPMPGTVYLEVASQLPPRNRPHFPDGEVSGREGGGRRVWRLVDLCISSGHI